jgi:streptomycin 6-kinase
MLPAALDLRLGDRVIDNRRMARSGYSSRPGFHELSERYQIEWSLHSDGAVIVGHNAVVKPVRTVDGTPAILRIGNQGEDVSDGWRALLLWDGDGAVRLLRHDPLQEVSLLERADCTRDLDVLPVGHAIAIAAGLRRRHDRPAPQREFRTLEALAARWSLDLPEAVRTPPDLRDRAAALCRELGPGANRHLVNVDLHYRNVLGASREPWLVIDPMPLAGDREFGLASLIWGRLEEADTMSLFDRLVEICDLDRDRAAAWTIVEATVKLTQSAGRVARNCETVARALARV